MNTKAFTLVELIVVITILAVLATIAFISFQGYTESSRDSVRLSDMANIEKGFNLMLAKDQKLPVPEDKIDITASGTVLTYQGYAGQKVLGILSVNGEGKDPLDNVYYTYATNPSRNKYQLLGFFENQNNVSMIKNTYADFTNRFPKVRGDELGILTDAISNEPIQKVGNNVDIVNTNNTYHLYLTNDDLFSIGNKTFLSAKLSFRINLQGSCNALLQNGLSTGNGIYTINPTGNEAFSVYCDMKNGGYTGLFSVDPSGTTWKYDSDEWVIPTVKKNDFLIQETTLKSYEYLNTNSIKICRGDLHHCYIMNHNKNIPLIQFYRDNISHTEFSKFQMLSNYAIDHSYNNNIGGPSNIGEYNLNEYLTSLGLSNVISYVGTSRYSKYGLGINLYPRNRLGFQADNNNTWPSFDNFSVGVGGFAPYGNFASSCGIGYPYPYNLATSIFIAGQECYIENPDTQMWYVLGK